MLSPSEGTRQIRHSPNRARRSGAAKIEIVRTKGDANNARDPWVSKLEGTTAWRVRLVVPKAGLAIAWLRSPIVRTISIFAAPLLLALFGLWRIWRVPSDRESNEDQDAPPRATQPG